MGRAERRRQERLQKLEEKRNSVTLNKEDLREIKEKISAEAAKSDVEILMTCFALAEHRLYGFGQKRILKSLQYIDALMGDILSDSKTIDDYRRELEEEAHVVVKF